MVALGCDVDPRGVTSTCEASGDLFLEVPGQSKKEVVVTFTSKSNAIEGFLQGGNYLSSYGEISFRLNFFYKVFGLGSNSVRPCFCNNIFKMRWQSGYDSELTIT